MKQDRSTPEHLYSLDILRGIAALSVVFWHWKHFFFSGTKLGAIDATRLPFSKWLFILYSNGWLAVDLFFTISGFVFYWLYSRRVVEGTISPGKFALLRFSRLYPLHLATLLIVAASQIWLMNAKGSYWVYENNDGKNFLLNLLLASSWGTEPAYTLSFNGPIWSVSVEVLLYGAFFACCRLLPVRAVVLAVISITGFHVVEGYYPPIGRGIGSFFLGGCMFLAYQEIIASRRVKILTKWSAYLMVSVWVTTLAIILNGVELSSLSVRSVPLLGQFDVYFHLVMERVSDRWPVLVLFPITILSLALIETQRGSLGKRFSFLGDISYSSYLLQFPLQLLFAAVVARFALTDSVYYSPWFMSLFFVALIISSLGSHRYFEMPAQRFLRLKGKP